MHTIVDLFCGAGGTSAGFVDACKELGVSYDLTVVNHWSVAIATHKLNHPEAKHICSPLEDVCPTEAVQGHIHHLHASPECIHHSRAAGGRPRNPQSRATAMWVIHWARKKRPDLITVENVQEFLDWGPLDQNGRPVKRLKGNHYRKWVHCLECLGYVVEHRILNAADYGDPTSRKRLIMIARRDGLPIVWPKRTHASRKEQAKGIDTHLPTWRSASEIIDWSDKGESIFRRKKPLAPKTIARIVKGLEKFGGLAAEPFLLVLRNHQHSQSMDDPLPTLTAGGGHHAVVEPILIRYNGTGFAEDPDDPQEPHRTIDATNGRCNRVVQGFLVAVNHGASSKEDIRAYSPEDPLGTTTSKRDKALVQPFIVHTDHTGTTGRGSYEDYIGDPLKTITQRPGFALCEPFIVPQFGEREGQEPRTHSLFEPAPAVTSHGAGALVCPIIIQTEDGQTIGLDISLRMLRNDELAAATGFPAGYLFEGSKADVTKQIGNAVPKGLSKSIKLALLQAERMKAVAA